MLIIKKWGIDMEIILLIFVIIAVWWYFRTFKVPKVGSLTLVTGGVKAGKSTFAIHLALRTYKRVLRSWKIRTLIRKLLNKLRKKPKDMFEKPLLYSNIPLLADYVPVTEDLLLRRKRFTYGSVIYIGEVSLVADSQLFRDTTLNDRLMFFNKLIGHELQGGSLIYDTQCIGDCHYSVRRCLSDYFYVHHVVKWIPFFLIAYVMQSRYSEDGSVVAVDTEDIEKRLTKVVVPKKVWKKFDSYCYSTYTDDLDVEDRLILNSKKSWKCANLKAKEVVSFRDLSELDKARTEGKDEKKN